MLLGYRCASTYFTTYDPSQIQGLAKPMPAQSADLLRELINEQLTLNNLQQVFGA